MNIKGQRRISPNQVTNQFVHLYYDLISNKSNIFPSLYTKFSTLNHGQTLHATGIRGIASVAARLPMYGKVVRLHSVTSQAIPNSNRSIVVNVQGWCDTVPFMQTFVLMEHTNSLNGHYYCANDILTLSTTTPKPSSSSCNNLPDNDAISTGNANVPATIEDMKLDEQLGGLHGEPSGSKTRSWSSIAAPKTAVNPNTSTAVSQSTRKSIGSEGTTTVMKEDSSSSSGGSGSGSGSKTGLKENNEHVDDCRTRRRARNNNSSTVREKSRYDHGQGESSKAGMRKDNDIESTRTRRRNMDGPTVVVDLTASGVYVSADWAPLRRKLQEEFDQYGYKVQRVHVNTLKGIAFIEYECVEGVRAAVEKWANGPRTQGGFAGIGLYVSEKRQRKGRNV